MKKVLRLVLILTFLVGAYAPDAHGINFSLDSIATWGKFPRFCVNTYRWGDRFFNGYDTTYVVGTGYKFNAKAIVNSWSDGYIFSLPDDWRILMMSEPSTSMGLSLTYMAVSAGYDVNVSKLFGGRAASRKRWHFGFNCMLFAADIYYSHNNSPTTIRRVGPRGDDERVHIPFHGIDNESFGLEAYYFFNHKKYSEAASFNFSRIQQRSQGAFYLGFSFEHRKIKFDFRGMPTDILLRLPSNWKNYSFRSDSRIYAVRVGYGYNWVFRPGWVLGVSESPVIGISDGTTNSETSATKFTVFNRFKASVVWNHDRWFASISGRLDLNIINDRQTTYAGGDLTGEAVFGYRFNLW